MGELHRREEVQYKPDGAGVVSEGFGGVIGERHAE
jgi:hypothetical protein